MFGSSSTKAFGRANIILVLYAEMADLVVKCMLCPWSSACQVGLYHAPQVGKNSTLNLELL